MEKTRVLLISHTCQSRTEGQPKAEILARMDDVVLSVLVPDRWKHYGSWREADVGQSSKLFHVGKVWWPWMGPAQFYLHWYPELKRLIKIFQPDVIDLWEEPWGLVSAHTIRLRNKFFPHIKVISETEQNLNRTLPPPFETFRSYTLKHADFLIGRSNEAVQVACDKGYCGPACTVPNAVDTELFLPLDKAVCRQALGWDPGFFVAGYVGRLVERKGLRDLVDAVKLCPADVAIAFVGDGEMREWLTSQAESPQLNGRILMVPSKPLSELPSVMNALDVMALPSRTVPTWKEQFGRVIIEANACAVPVIGSDSGAIPEVVEDGGLVFPEGNVQELAAAIMRLHADRDLCARMGQAGYQQVMAKYTWQRVAEKMADIYRQVAGKTGG